MSTGFWGLGWVMGCANVWNDSTVGVGRTRNARPYWLILSVGWNGQDCSLRNASRRGELRSKLRIAIARKLQKNHPCPQKHRVGTNRKASVTLRSPAGDPLQHDAGSCRFLCEIRLLGNKRGVGDDAPYRRVIGGAGLLPNILKYAKICTNYLLALP